MTRLSLNDISVELGDRMVLHGISCDVEAGEFVGLIGPNGAGKSTLLRATLGLVPATGSVRLNGVEAACLSPRLRARSVAYLPQEREIAWPVSVATLVALGRAPHGAVFAGPTPADEKAIEKAMRRMDIADFRDRRATDLSGGEKARVLIARALTQEAPLLLADEPTAGLDPSHQIGLMRLFADLAREGRAIVASMHDLGLAARWCSRLVLLDQGRIVADGSPQTVLTRQRLRAIYRVEAHIEQEGDGMIVQPVDIAMEEPSR